MESAKCICDEMMKRTERGDGIMKFREHVSLSWSCDVHGAVTADFRTVNHTHPPAYIPRHETPKPKYPHPMR